MSINSLQNFRCTMYRNLFFVSAAVFALSACSSPEPKSNPELNVQCETTQALAGGWHEAAITPEAEQAALLAIASMEGSQSLQEVTSVEQQVVAGMNYKVAFTINDGTAYVTKVFRSLQGQYELISLQPKPLVDECDQYQATGDSNK